MRSRNLPEFNFSLFKKYRLTVLEGTTTKPKLYLVNADSIVGPIISIPDAFGATPLQVSGPSIPDVDYSIFMSRRQNEWADIWEEFILAHDVRVNVAGESESEDDDYDEKADVPVFKGGGTSSAAEGAAVVAKRGKQKRSNGKCDIRKGKKPRGTTVTKKNPLVQK